MAKKKIIKEEPMTINELLFASSLCKKVGLVRENIVKGNGLFTALKVKSPKFVASDIALIQKGFKQRFNRTLLFNEQTNQSNNYINVGYFTKAMA
jgi:hypothetical protein